MGEERRTRVKKRGRAGLDNIIFFSFHVCVFLSASSPITSSPYLPCTRHLLSVSLALHPSPCVFSPSTSDLPPSPAVPGLVEAVKALAVDSQSVLVARQSPSQPNGVITKYTVHVDQPDQQVLTPLPSLSRLPLVG